MIIDSHIHLWDDQLVASAGWLTGTLGRSISLDEFESVRGAVACAVVVTAEQSERETRRLLSLCEGHDSVFAVVGWLDVAVAGVGERGADLRAAPGGRGFAGMRHSVISEQDGWLEREDVRAGVEEYSRTGLPFEVLVSAHQLDDVAVLAARFDELTIIVDHLGNPPAESGGWDAWRASFMRLAARPNVVAKVSGLGGRRSPIDVALDLFGVERLMFGSDWPVSSTRVSYAAELAWAQAATTGLSASERDALFGLTAERVYGAAA